MARRLRRSLREVEEKVVEESNSNVKKLVIDINKTYRKGDVVPQEVYEQWKNTFNDVDSWFE